MSITKLDYKEQLLEQIRSIDHEGLSNDFEIVATSAVLEEQKVFFWIRLYLSEENPNIQVGDDVLIEWTPSGEKLSTKFAAYGKTGLERDHEDQVVNYNPEDDKKILCLMIDERMVNFNPDIPFIRTLFKTGYYYEFQLVKREELLFSIEKNGHILDYYDCDF
jgi:hypothetical protein